MWQVNKCTFSNSRKLVPRLSSLVACDVFLFSFHTLLDLVCSSENISKLMVALKNKPKIDLTMIHSLYLWRALSMFFSLSYVMFSSTALTRNLYKQIHSSWQVCFVFLNLVPIFITFSIFSLRISYIKLSLYTRASFKQGWPKKPKPKKTHPRKKTQKTQCKKSSLRWVFLGCLFLFNKSMFRSKKRMRIVLGYIHAFKTMINSVNNLQVYYENMILIRRLISF